MRTNTRSLAVATAIATAASLSLTPAAGAAPHHAASVHAGPSSGLVLDVTGGQPPATNDFNPLVPTSTLVGWTAVGYIYEPLLQYDMLKPGTVYPWLATSATWSNGDKTLTFHLRHGVTWSDGVPFTSKDVVFTFDLLKRYPSLNSNGITFTSVKAEGPYTVVMNFAKPSFVQEPNIAWSTWILPEHIWANVKNPETFQNPDPIGTGPFKIASVSPDYLTLTKNPDYWQKGEPKVSEIRLVGADSGTTMDLYIDEGQLDWGGAFVQDIQKVFVARDPSTNHYWFPNLQITSLVTNVLHWPLSDVTVRKAISLAINRPLISKEGEEDYQPPVHTETGLILPNDSSYLLAKYKDDNYVYDPAEAKRLLEADGFKMGKNGYFQKDGKTLAFTIVEPSGFTDYVTDDQIMISELKKVGMDVSFDGVSQNAWTADLESGSFDASLDWSGLGVTPYYLYDSILDYGISAPLGKTAYGDYERWDNPQTQAYLTEYKNSSTQAQRYQAIAGLEGVMVNDLPVVPVFYTANWGEWRTDKFVGWPTPQNPYAPISPEDPQSAEVVVLHLQPAH